MKIIYLSPYPIFSFVDKTFPTSRLYLAIDVIVYQSEKRMKQHPLGATNQRGALRACASELAPTFTLEETLEGAGTSSQILVYSILQELFSLQKYSVSE